MIAMKWFSIFTAVFAFAILIIYAFSNVAVWVTS